MTVEYRRQRLREYQLKYAHSAKGRITRRRYDTSAKGRARSIRANKSAKGKARAKRYLATAKGKAIRKRFRQSPKGKATTRRSMEKRILIGDRCIGTAATAEQARAINAFIRSQRLEFIKGQQSRAQAEAAATR